MGISAVALFARRFRRQATRLAPPQSAELNDLVDWTGSADSEREPMRSMATIVGLVVALGGGYFFYQTYLAQDNFAQAPQQQIDIVGIRSALLAIGQAERQYLVAHATYGTLEQLRDGGLLTVGAEQRGYIFSVAIDGSRGFTITAAPSNSNKLGGPTLAINETMQITER